MSAAVYSNTNKEETKVGSAVRRLTLVNFRNYKYLRLNLAQPFVILSGENGSGKTNVLEAVSFYRRGAVCATQNFPKLRLLIFGR